MIQTIGVISKAHNMVVMGFGIPLNEQKALDRSFEKSLIKYDVQVLRGLDVFPPTRDYSDKDIYKIAQSKGADTILMIRADRRAVSKTYVPRTHHPGKYHAQVSKSYFYGGRNPSIETYTKPAYRSGGFTTGGYTLSTRSMNVSVKLKNTKNKETIWQAEGFSNGDGFASFSDLTVSVVKMTVEELFKEGLIAETKVETTDSKD